MHGKITFIGNALTGTSCDESMLSSRGYNVPRLRVLANLSHCDTAYPGTGHDALMRNTASFTKLMQILCLLPNSDITTDFFTERFASPGTHE
jgi:hypothetical protein